MSGLETELASLIVRYYRREIGVLMQQAEHWAVNRKPLAVHHRIMKADSYYQVVAHFERHGNFGQDAFDMMRREIERPDVYPAGAYPPSEPVSRYRDPVHVAKLLKGDA